MNHKTMEYRWRLGRLSPLALAASFIPIIPTNPFVQTTTMQQQHKRNKSACCLSAVVVVQGPCAAVVSRQQQQQRRHLNPFIVTTETGNRFTLPPASPPPCSGLIKLRKINAIPHETWIKIMQQQKRKERGESYCGGRSERLHSWHFELLAFLTFLGSGISYTIVFACLVDGTLFFNWLKHNNKNRELRKMKQNCSHRIRYEFWMIFGNLGPFKSWQFSS